MSSKYAVKEVRATEVSLAMVDIPFEIMERRSAYCSRHGVVIQFDEPDWGLDAFLWRTTVETVVKVHRYHERFQKELATYRRLAERKIVRLKGFEFPQLVNYDEELHILELSIVSPPYILDFVEVGLGKKPGDFDLERIETQQSKQFGNDWPKVRRAAEKKLLEVLSPGIVCCPLSPDSGERVRVRGFSLFQNSRVVEKPPHPACGHLLPRRGGEGAWCWNW